MDSLQFLWCRVLYTAWFCGGDEKKTSAEDNDGVGPRVRQGKNVHSWVLPAVGSHRDGRRRVMRACIDRERRLKRAGVSAWVRSYTHMRTRAHALYVYI